MYTTLKHFLQTTPAYPFFIQVIQDWVLLRWYVKGRPLPPPHLYKQRTISKYAKQYETPVLIETGTYLGVMVIAMLNHFRTIHTIELDSQLFREVQKKITASHVHFYHGDSSAVLPSILKKIDQPCLFWLDGHYSSGITAKGKINTPILGELKAIKAHEIKNHAILIDDARCFNGKDDYPTIAKLGRIVKSDFPAHHMKITNDIIAIVPKPT